MSAVEVTVGSNLEYAGLLQELAEKAAAMEGLEEGACLHVGLAVREAVTNAMLHGNLLDRDRKVVLRLNVHQSQLIVEVDDEGQGFDPGAVPDPRTGENLLKPSGRGILLVQSLMDRVDVLPRPGGGTRLRMTKALTAELKRETP